MVESPSDKYSLMYLLLKIIVLSLRDHYCVEHRRILMFFRCWLSFTAQDKLIPHEQLGEYCDVGGACAMCSNLGVLELDILDGIQEGLSGMLSFLCGI